MWHRWGEQVGKLLGRDRDRDDANVHSEEESCFDPEGKEEKPVLKRRWSKRVGLPRAPTFKRQNSERRINLEPVEQGHTERRTASLTAEHRRALSGQRTRSPLPPNAPRLSAPEFRMYDNENAAIPAMDDTKAGILEDDEVEEAPPATLDHSLRRRDSAVYSDIGSNRDRDDEEMLEIELDRKWILNLSMHFRDKSDREKFFVTYAETPTLWRRVTVSCDYRSAPPDSLEKDLKELQFQRDKSARIYESIRESLPEIQFYPTVTNLKLETREGRLHVHVTEDVNEIIPYPSISSVKHLDRPAHIQDRDMYVRERDLEFDAHLSGFVYKVRSGGNDFIKKEIPGPDTVDEFLYEINALHALSDSESVIRFEGIIVDDNDQVVKGLLISYAERGALVDLLYDYKGYLDWPRREKWAKQIVQGLMEIHEAGYVQGDFTLSNIVVDGNDKAKIIDINRRGCPVGWEPPEISKKIESNQRISMYIGVKSDMFQLGMTLWALAMDEDEPERQDRPLTMDNANPEVPEYYRELVMVCLADRPQDRPSAKELLAQFPDLELGPSRDDLTSRRSLTHSSRSDGHYIDPSFAVEREDIAREMFARQESNELGEVPSTVDGADINPPDSSDLQFESSGSYVVGRRGRRPPTNAAHLEDPHRRRRSRSVESSTESDSEPQVINISPSHGQDYEEINIDGRPYLFHRGTFNSDDIRILEADESGPRANEVVEVAHRQPNLLGQCSESAALTTPSISNSEDIRLLDTHGSGFGTSEMVETAQEDELEKVETADIVREGVNHPQLVLSDQLSVPTATASSETPRETLDQDGADDDEIDLESSKMDSILIPSSLSEQTIRPERKDSGNSVPVLEDSLTGDLAGVGGHTTLEACGRPSHSSASESPVFVKFPEEVSAEETEAEDLKTPQQSETRSELCSFVPHDEIPSTLPAQTKQEGRGEDSGQSNHSDTAAHPLSESLFASAHSTLGGFVTPENEHTSSAEQ